MITYGTLCLIMKDNKILLLKKSKELFGGERWNAPGGKIKGNESLEDCAIREVFEETGLRVDKLKEIGKLNFFNGQNENPDWIVHVFITKTFQGDITEGREGMLKWFNINEVPFEEMWEDDKYWYKYILENKKFEGNFYFKKDFKNIINHEIEVL